ncbi:MAG: rhodanese-like domain-containing protein [Syntrophorhabdaceae bacterium]|nr:rhodanese-like domain-containing protein [Syntrophorhabdaceae bacterium]
MKKHVALALFLMILSAPTILYSEQLPSVVSASWLNENLNNPKLLVLDIRKIEDYREGHIPGALSLTYAAWRTMGESLDCQLPHRDELSDTICSSGINADTYVVIAGNTDLVRQLVNATRVAWTLKYAGVKRPAILDGGYKMWLVKNYPVTKDWVKRPKSYYKCKWNKSVLATKEYITSHFKELAIVDTRPEKLYRGEVSDPMLKRKGHIPGAINLPYSLVFHRDGSFTNPDALKHIAMHSVGNDQDKGIVVLCCNGQFASSWWFVLSEVLGYKNVSIYDGSMEEWCGDKDAPLVESTGGK